MILTLVRIRMAGTRRVSRVARDPRGARVEGLVVCIYHSGFDVLSWMGGRITGLAREGGQNLLGQWRDSLPGLDESAQFPDPRYRTVKRVFRFKLLHLFLKPELANNDILIWRGHVIVLSH